MQTFDWTMELSKRNFYSICFSLVWFPHFLDISTVILPRHTMRLTWDHRSGHDNEDIVKRIAGSQRALNNDFVPSISSEVVLKKLELENSVQI